MRRKQPYRFAGIKRFIYLYIILLIIEGAFRKWITPGLSNPLLIVRDPVALLIYIFAFKQRCFPMNGYILGAIVLGFFSFLFGMFSEYSNLYITLYGLRINYFHVPLMFVFPYVFTREEVYTIGRYLLLAAVPMTAILVMQFYSPQTHVINFGPGGEPTLGLTGGKGRFRPSGTFSFITGVAAFYAICFAYIIAYLIERKKLNFYILAASGMSIVIAIPASMSRQLAITCGLVIIAAVFALWRKKDSSRLVLRTLIVSGILIACASFLPVFDEGVASFADRWEQATGDDIEGFNEAIVGRVTSSIGASSDVFSKIELTGVGVGMGSNVAAKMLTGEVGFLFAEDEFSRIMIELGPILGVIYIFYRALLFFYVFKYAYKAMKARNVLPILLVGSSGFLIISGQWAPPTILGFAIVGGGLALAACNPPEETATQKAARRRAAAKVMVPPYYK